MVECSPLLNQARCGPRKFTSDRSTIVDTDQCFVLGVAPPVLRRAQDSNRLRIPYGFVRLMVRYTVGLDPENNSPRSEIVYSPVWCMRFSSRCRIADSFG